jgi:hypothetical protein
MGGIRVMHGRNCGQHAVTTGDTEPTIITTKLIPYRKPNSSKSISEPNIC